VVSLFLVFGHFVLPFLFVISRNIKRRLPLLGFAATWMLLVHVVDLYWFVMPYVEVGHFVPSVIDIFTILAVAGIYLAVVFRDAKRHALVPVGDPQLDRCLSFHNP
jgi:uncharacterized membrane protein YpjA